jgi:hypothetical protein
MDSKTSSLDAVKSRFKEFRSNRKSIRERIPDELWSMAIELSKKQGLSRVAKELGLSPTDLRKRITKAKTRHENLDIVKVAPIHIVNQAKQPRTQISVEIENPNGARLRLRGLDGDDQVLQSLIRSFTGGDLC